MNEDFLRVSRVDITSAAVECFVVVRRDVEMDIASGEREWFAQRNIQH